MALHGGMLCLKYVVFFFNFVFWLAGMGVLGLAIWLRFDPMANHYIIGGYGNNANDYYIITYILMGAGGLMTLVGFLGCCGAYQESKCMLGTFFVFLLVIFGAELAGGIWAFVHKDEVQGSVVTTFQNLVKKDYGKDTSEFSSINYSIDFIQEKLMCCGGKDPKDWDKSYWAAQDPIKRLGKVPKSCCKEGNLKSQCQKNGAVIATQSSMLINIQGCGPKVILQVQGNLSIMIGVGLGIAALELLGMIFSVWLCCSMHRSEGGGYKA